MHLHISVTLRLLDFDEEYVFGLPSAYARSILTTPWAELGDRVTLTCQKTNYSAAVMFHTKVGFVRQLTPPSLYFLSELFNC